MCRPFTVSLEVLSSDMKLKYNNSNDIKWFVINTGFLRLRRTDAFVQVLYVHANGSSKSKGVSAVSQLVDQ